MTFCTAEGHRLPWKVLWKDRMKLSQLWTVEGRSYVFLLLGFSCLGEKGGWMVFSLGLYLVLLWQNWPREVAFPLYAIAHWLFSNLIQVLIQACARSCMSSWLSQDGGVQPDGWEVEPGILSWSSMWVARIQVFKSSPTASPGCLAAGTWIRSEAEAGSWIGSQYGMQASQVVS